MPPIRLMLIDNNSTFLQILTRFLQRFPEVAVVGAAHSGEEAVSQVALLRPGVVLLDLAMPGLNGMETIPLLRQALPQAKIIILTLLGHETYRQAAMAAGADGFLAKANLDSELLPAIRKVAQDGP